MVRNTFHALLLALLAVGVLASLGTAEEAKKKAEPELATDEEVAQALAEFKEAWKAKGLKGDDKVMQRDYAMRLINELHHPAVIKALGKASKSSDEDVRLIALIYLGDQQLLPHQAAQYVLGAMKKHRKDVVIQMTALQSLGRLKYAGASHQLRAALKHKHFVVRKAAISAVGDIGDTRMLPDVLKVLGVKLETDNKGGKDTDKKESKKEVVSEGYSWEGAEATVDRGEADNSKEMADAKRIAEAQIARNKAAAQAGKGGGGGGGGGVGGIGGSGGRGGSSRSTEEMIPTILRTLKKLTGEEFKKPSQIRIWLREKKDWLADKDKQMDALEKAQKADK